MFTTIPSNFSSLYEDTIFAFSAASGSDFDSDTTVDIINADSEETLVVKKFYSSADFQVNATPFVRPLTYPDIVAAPTGFVDDSTLNMGMMWVYVADDRGDQCGAVLLTQSKHGEPAQGVVSSIGSGLQRVLSIGERDLIRLYFDPSEQVTVVQRQYISGLTDPMAEVSYEGVANSTGFATFSLVAENLSESVEGLRQPDLERIEIDVCDEEGEVISTLRYIVIEPPYKATRVAWVSSYGSIEHYTLPNAEERRRTSEGVQYLKLRSAPECDAMREVISEVVEASRVWVVGSDDNYIEAEVVSESVDLTPRAALSSVQFEIEYSYE